MLFPKDQDREAAAMTTEMRKSGIDVVGDMPWGTHFCLFYETKEDLLETLVPYCKAGLESQEFCLWVVALKKISGASLVEVRSLLAITSPSVHAKT
jgi:hypothetical protein